MSYQFLSIPQQQSKKLYKYFSKIDYAIDSIEKQRIHLDKPYNSEIDDAVPPPLYYYCSKKASPHKL